MQEIVDDLLEKRHHTTLQQYILNTALAGFEAKWQMATNH